MDGSSGLMGTSADRSAYSGNGKSTRAVWVKPSLRGCVVAAALFALWTAPGAVVAQSLGDQPGLLGLLTSDAAPDPTTESVLPTVEPTRNEGEQPPSPGDEDADYDEGPFPEPTDPIEVEDNNTPTPTEATTPTTTESKTPTPTESKTPTPTESKTPTPTETQTPTPTEPATVVPTPPEPPTPTPTTATPAMRTHPADPTTATVGANISNANASHVHGVSAGVSPLVLVGMAAMCAVFLLVWSRRRRGGADGGGGGGGGADVSAMSGMATTSSTEKSGPEGKKVQYSRIEDRPEEDDEDAEFGGRSGSWEDWEGSGGGGGGHHRIAVMAMEEEKEDDYEQENSRGTAKLTKGMGSSSSSSLTPPSSPPRSSGGGFVRTSTAGVKLGNSPPPVATVGSLQHDRLKEIVQAETKQQKAPSVASNSSNESFEVVAPAHEQPIDLLSGSLTPPKPQPPASKPEDDLFSQFGMVPTFKKGVQQPPAPVARSSLAVEPLNPFAVSPPPSVSASSLFAADLEDVSAGMADASNEWGEEDDDWVQGL